MKRNLKVFTILLVVIGIATLVLDSCKKDEKNSVPVVSSVLVNPSTVSAGSIATVTVTATDADGDALTYTYLPNGGAINGTGPSVMWTAPAVAGAYSVAVTVTDGQGGTANGTGALTVQQVSTSTKITGTASFPAGTSGDLSNSKVSIYTSWENWNANQPIKFVATQGSGASVTFEMVDVLPGNYYLDVWKDIDNSAGWSSGDYVGWYGSGGLGSPSLTEFQVAAGQIVTTTVQMYIIAKSDKLAK